jgi:DNA invertase Pin-like site-specific DNA recombinase
VLSSGQPFRTGPAMPRASAYVRVSTAGQTTDNQLQEIRAAGFTVEPRRVVTETISGSVATARRRGFARLLDRLEPGDVLMVTKLDRAEREWRMPPREWALAKAQFAVLFGERFTQAMAG